MNSTSDLEDAQRIAQWITDQIADDSNIVFPQGSGQFALLDVEDASVYLVTVQKAKFEAAS